MAWQTDSELPEVQPSRFAFPGIKSPALGRKWGMSIPVESRPSLNANPVTQPPLLTQQQFFDAFMPLLLALHEKRVIDFAELPQYYEDVLVRRTLDIKEAPENLAFLQSLIKGLAELAPDVKTVYPATGQLFP
jgi:hypothetical protein